MIGALEAQAGRLLYDTAARVRPGGWLDRLAFGSLRLLSWLPLSSKRAKRVLGRLYALRGDAGEAERWLASALGAGGSLDGVTRYHLGVAQLAGGRVDAAVANLRAAVGAHPGRDWYHLKLAEALQARGLHGEAEEHIREALRLKPSSALAHFRLFMALRPRLGDGAALDAWLDAVLSVHWMENPEIHPDWWLVHNDVHTPERVSRVEQLIARYPDAHECRQLLAYLLRYSEHPDAGVPHLRLAGRALWRQRFPRGPEVPWEAAKPPTFVVIGLAKAGSTALYQYLCRHPLICRAQAKEINFWTDHYAAGVDWYRAFFPPIPPGSPLITGEATIKTFWDTEAPRRILEHFPGMKLILILREPVQRAFSEYSMMRRLGREKRDWTAYVEDRLDNLPRCPVTAEELEPITWQADDYLLRSAVLPYLSSWERFAARGNLLILHNADLEAATRETMNRLFAYLGLPPHDIVSPPRVNVGAYRPQPDALQLRLAEWYRPHQQALEDYLRVAAHG